MSRYTALIDGAPGGYGVSFPDLPGCVAMGETVEGAIEAAAEALRDWTEVTEARGGVVPEPRSADTLRAEARTAEALAAGAAFASVMLVREIGRPVKANLSLDAGILAAIDAAAERLKTTRSGLVEILAKTALPQLV